MLGGSTVPAHANVDIGVNQDPGKYTLKVTVIDPVTKAKQELTKEFEVLPKKFGLVRMYTTADSAGRIAITLADGGPSTYDAFQKYLVNPEPLPGVGDKAAQSVIGIVAVKGADRMCTIDAGGAPG